MNYSNSNKDSRSPFKKGELRDVVKPKSPRVYRPSHKSDKAVINSLVVDLVQVLAGVGINLKNVHTIVKALVKLGWVKTERIE